MIATSGSELSRLHEGDEDDGKRVVTVAHVEAVGDVVESGQDYVNSEEGFREYDATDGRVVKCAFEPLARVRVRRVLTKSKCEHHSNKRTTNFEEYSVLTQQGRAGQGPAGGR